ncbi:hypothetical protein BGX38DRAFT_1329210 [Terfezia claveryi]|nr:hypothetical protein BGX38DRAFT_1329210 [Terfezia claveryi]
MQLPTPGPTPGVELPSIFKQRSGGIIMREDAVTIGEGVKRKKWTEKDDPLVRKSEEEEEEEEACSGLNNKDRLLEKDRTIAGLEKKMRNSEKAYREMIGKLEKEVAQLRWEKNMWVEREEWVGNQLQIHERNWKEILVSERRKWQSKGKTEKAQVEVAVQTEAEIEKKGAGDSEDIAAPRSAARAGKNSQPAETPPWSTPSSDNRSAKAIVIHGVPCQRPMADIIQDVRVRGIMGARWLLGGKRRLGKATSFRKEEGGFAQ